MQIKMQKNIKIADIRIDGGTQQRDHENYAILFSDGVIKVGVTKRGSARVKEVLRKKCKEIGVGTLAFWRGDLLIKSSAYRVERDTCFLLKKQAITGCREWFLCREKLDFDGMRDEFKYFTQTLGMFGKGVRLNRGVAK